MPDFPFVVPQGFVLPPINEGILQQTRLIGFPDKNIYFNPGSSGNFCFDVRVDITVFFNDGTV